MLVAFYEYMRQPTCNQTLCATEILGHCTNIDIVWSAWGVAQQFVMIMSSCWLRDVTASRNCPKLKGNISRQSVQSGGKEISRCHSDDCVLKVWGPHILNNWHLTWSCLFQVKFTMWVCRTLGYYVIYIFNCFISSAKVQQSCQEFVKRCCFHVLWGVLCPNNWHYSYHCLGVTWQMWS